MRTTTNRLRILLLTAVLVAIPVTASAQRRVNRVEFEGNATFSAKTLRKLTRVGPGTFKRSWPVLKWLLKRPTFNYLVLSRDKTVLRAFYRNRGHLQCVVDDELEQIGDDGLIVRFRIQEGPLTRLRDLRFSGNTVFGDEEMRTALRRVRGLRLSPGDPISESAIQAGGNALLQMYREQGYYFADVAPRLGERDPDGAASVTFRITEGKQVHVDGVRVEGNRLAKDFIVTREVTLDPGDLLTESDRRESQRRLYLTGVFRSAGVTVGDVSADSTQATVLVTVSEQPPRYFSAGIGVASDEQEQIDLTAHTSAEWGHRDLFGTGRSLVFSASADFQVVTHWRQIRREASLRFTEPWFWATRTPLSAQFSFRPQSYDQYRVNEFAAELGMSREFTSRSRMSANLTYRRITTSIPAELLVRRDALRGMSLNWERDTRNNIFSPSSGSTTRLGTRAYGSFLGGPSYAVFTGWWSLYQLTSPSSVLASRLRIGFAEPYGGTPDVPIFDRFFAGGSSSVRGYSERQLGPVTAITDTSGVTTYQPRGGRALLLFSVAYRWPRLVGPLGALAFMDAGNVWASIGDMGKGLAASAGLGVFLDTPLGPLRLDYGWRLNQSVEEREIPGYRLAPGQFHVSVLHAF